MPQIVVIDPNPEARAAVERELQAQGYTVIPVDSLEKVAGVNGGSAGTQPLRLREIERAAIEAALRANHGNRTHAARQLGISLRKLQYRLKEYAVPVQE
ncbi:MAG TPA: helix-turn-helix domain-containing protein [Bryobacteraceae bacterium]|nr:helix-turn-helix domain-containing protein [Bryobacteraceae bacterium]